MLTFKHFLLEYRHRKWSIPMAQRKRQWRWTYQRIGDYFGVHPTTVFKALQSQPSKKRVAKKTEFHFSKNYFKKFFPKQWIEVYSDYWAGRGYRDVSVSGSNMEFTAEYNPSRKSVYVGFVRVADTKEGHANAKKVMEALYEMAEGTNAKRIELDAGLASGGYVWAKLGFRLAWPGELRSDWNLEQRIYATRDILPPREYQKVRAIYKAGGKDMNVKLADLNYPLTKRQFDKINGRWDDEYRTRKLHNPTLGKALMLGTFYGAYLPKERFKNLLIWAGKLHRRKLIREEEEEVELINIEDILFKIMEEEEEEDDQTNNIDAPRTEEGLGTS